ncbi:BMC domain-containing protein [Paenibacillus bouchesdurhonensis]|uniref:BMC domain-containing protein n=1 Tax=Paenibacillus bouchesdurhonensis TaxID=1870990 RepID=UPI0018FF9CB3|nr:BMC domain-containing protein [Paenibacillus bouchesdurhonensis]
MKSYEAIGVVEAQHFTTALELVDEMCKTSHVQLLGAEKYLGGRLISVIVAGSIANVTAAIEAAREVCAKKPSNPLKMSLVIPKPHGEIMKFIIPVQEEGEAAKITASESLLQETVAQDSAVQNIAEDKDAPRKKKARQKPEPEKKVEVSHSETVQDQQVQTQAEVQTQISSPRKGMKKRK